ncbi:MAG: YkgJ family cysteine cluster protein [Planctomycetes bacterium]|nr:YkgJ family cysteine cluster protein [Planctomycetota bacterium]
MSKPWFDKGLQFKCTQCGDCCRTHGQYAYVYLAEGDVEALSKHLGLDRGAFLERYCQEDEGWITLRIDEPACPFLNESNGCDVYEARPKQCRSWPFWEENLDRATWEGPVSECCPGIGEGPVMPAEEVLRIARDTERWYEGS